MTVKHMRIDDRLIHGQIVTAWIRDSKAKMIIVADDQASKDPTQKMLLKLVTPKDIELRVDTVENIASTILEVNENVDILLIVRSPKSAYELLSKVVLVDSINVGNISNSKSETGRKTLLPYIHVEKQDMEYLEMIHKLNIHLDVRAVPTDKSIDGFELIKKHM